MPNDLLDKPVATIPIREDRGLRVKIGNAWESLGVKTIRDAVGIRPEQLVGRSGFGRKAFSELRRALAEIGLRLRDDDGASYDTIFGRWHRAGRPVTENRNGKP